MSKTAASVLAGFCFLLFSIPMAAQFNGLLPNGNVYVGASYGQLTDIINRQSYKGFDGSVEALPFTRFSRLGIVIDGGGYYRRGTEKVTQYFILAGPRISLNYGKWRPFIQAFGGFRHVNSVGFIYNPVAVDVGGGADYRLHFKSFSWRFQGDYIYSHYGSAYQNDYRASTGPVWRF